MPKVYPTDTELIFGDNDLLHYVWNNKQFRCGGNCYFRGIIDEVMIFDRALSDDEILKLATQEFVVEPLNKLTTTWEKLNGLVINNL